jgi:hypothetical protein
MGLTRENGCLQAENLSLRQMVDYCSEEYIAIPIVVRYRVLGFEESGVRSQDSGFRSQELRFWCTS